jgi:tetratricopeptide (TPR) repeat protein
MKNTALTGLPLAALLAALLLLPACDRQAKQQTARLQASVESLQKRCDALEADSAQAAQQAADLKTRADALAAERDDLRAKLSAAHEQVKQLGAQAADTKKASAGPAAAPGADAGAALLRLEALGSDLFQDGNYSAAAAVLLSACDLGSKDPLVYYRLAYSNAAMGKYSASIGWYEKALAALAQQPKPDPDLQKKCLTDYGVALAQTGKAKEAIAAYTKALALDPAYTPALYDVALLYAKSAADKDKAIDALRQHVAHGGTRSISARELLQELLGPAPAGASPAP